MEQTDISRSTNPSCAPKHLWQCAIDSADDDVKTALDLTKTGKRDVLQAVRKAADEKREQALWKFWRCAPPCQGTVILRDLLEKIVCWIDVLRDSDAKIPKECQTAWRLLWSPFWFLLRRPVEDVEAFGRLIYDLEYAARLIVEYEILDMEKPGPFTSPESPTKNALVLLYDGILRLLAFRIRIAVHESTQHQEAISSARDKLSARESELHVALGLVSNTKLTPNRKMYGRGCENSLVQKVAISQDLRISMRTWITGNVEYDWTAPTTDPICSSAPPVHADFLGSTSLGSWWGSSSSSLLSVHNPRNGTHQICGIIREIIPHTAANSKQPAPLFYIDCTGKSSGQEILKSILAELAFGTAERLETWDSVIAEYHVQLSQAEMQGKAVPSMTISDCLKVILDITTSGPITILLDQVAEQVAALVHTYMADVVDQSDNVVKVLIAVDCSNPEDALFRENLGLLYTEHTSGIALFLRNARPPPTLKEMESWCEPLKPGANLSSVSPSEQSDALFTALEAGQLSDFLSLIRHIPGILDHLRDNAPAIAALHNHVPLLSYLLTLPRFATATSPLASALHLAVLANRFRCTALLLSHAPAAPDPNSQFSGVAPSLSTPLLAAATRNHPCLIRVLLAHGADPKVVATSNRLLTPLFVAASVGAIDAVQALLAAGVADGCGTAAEEAAAAASDAGHHAVAQLLVDQVAEMRRSGRKKRSNRGGSGSGFRCCRMPRSEFKSLLREESPGWPKRKRIPWDYGGVGAATAAPVVVQEVGDDAVQRLVRMVDGGDLAGVEKADKARGQRNNILGNCGNILAALAVAGRVDAVRKVMEQRELLDIGKDRVGQALQEAAWAGQLRLVQLFSESGLELGDGFYSSALRGAVSHGHIDVVDFLVQQNKSKDNPQKTMEEVVKGACRRGDSMALRVLRLAEERFSGDELDQIRMRS